MKKFIKISISIILILIIILVTAPFIFKGKIIKTANEQLSNNLNAHASFQNINLSLIRNFPNLSIRISDLTISGIDKFEGDTLLHIASLDIAVNLISAIKMENIIIKKIIIDHPYVNAIILKDGKANWDIVKETTAEKPETKTESSGFKSKISLKIFKINNAIIRYTDYSSNMSMSLQNLNFRLTGNMSNDFTQMVLDSKTDKVNFMMDGIPYLKNVLLQIHIDLDADIKNSVYTLKQNQFSLNNLVLKLDGTMELPPSGDINTNLHFATTNTDFKTILSLIPAIYMKDYSGVKASGSILLDGKIKGTIGGKINPDVDAKILIKDASFSYPGLPKSVENIQLDSKIHYDGVQMDSTTADIDKFHFEIGGNPVDINLNLKTPMSDPLTKGKIQAILDLGSIQQIVPLDNMELKGMINANIDWAGKLSSIENGKYQDFKADGKFLINNLYYNSPDLTKPFTLEKAEMIFSSKEININSFSSKLGASDFRLQGKISNYIPYVLKDEILKGDLMLNSSQIDLNEFMAEDQTKQPAPVDTVPLTIVEIPGNLDFKLNSTIGKILYEKIIITSISGIIIAKDKSLLMDQLKMNMLDGSVSLSGEYNTQDLSNPFVNLNFQAKGIDIPKAAVAFSTISKVAPVAAHATGKVTLAMTLKTDLAKDMTPVTKSINGQGNLQSDKIGLKSSPAFSKIGAALKTKAFDNLVLNNLNIKFEIVNGNIMVEPFEAKIGNNSVLISGEQSLDNTMNFNFNITALKKDLGLDNSTINSLYDNAAKKGLNIQKSETINVLAKVTGPVSDPKVSLDLKENAKQATQALKEELKNTVNKEIETKKIESKEKAKAEADKLLKEADKQAAVVKADAKKAAELVRSEANSNANKLVNEAKNPLSKAAAKPAADKLRSEGEKKAKLIESEGDTKANKILQEAHIKANNLLK